MFFAFLKAKRPREKEKKVGKKGVIHSFIRSYPVLINQCITHRHS